MFGEKAHSCDFMMRFETRAERTPSPPERKKPERKFGLFYLA